VTDYCVLGLYITEIYRPEAIHYGSIFILFYTASSGKATHGKVG